MTDKPLRLRRLRFEVDQPARSGAPGNIGVAVRGAVLDSVRKATCKTGAQQCAGCPVASACVYGVMTRVADGSGFPVSHNLHMPRYALQLSGLAPSTAGVQPGFAIGLIGQAVDHAEAIADALSRVQFWSGLRAAGCDDTDWEPHLGSSLERRRCLIELHSPLRLTRTHPYPARFDPALLVAGIALRLHRLARFEGLQPAVIPLAETRDDIILGKCVLRAAEGGTANRRGMDFRGLLGRFEVEIADRWLPILKAGQWVNAGRQTAYGAGEFRVDLPGR